MQGALASHTRHRQTGGGGRVGGRGGREGSRGNKDFGVWTLVTSFPGSVGVGREGGHEIILHTKVVFPR